MHQCWLRGLLLEAKKKDRVELGPCPPPPLGPRLSSVACGLDRLRFLRSNLYARTRETVPIEVPPAVSAASKSARLGRLAL